MLNLINPPTLPNPPSKYSHIVEVPDGTRLAFISGQVAIDAAGNTPDDIAGQCELVLRNVELALEAAGMEVTDLVRLNSYLVDAADVATFREIRDRWAGGHAAASTLVVVAALASPGWKVEVEAVAARAK